MSLRDNYHGRFTDMTRSLCQGKKFRIAPVPHVITGRVGALVASSESTGTAATVQTHSTTLSQEKSDHSSESQKLAGTKVSSFRSQDKKKHSSTKEGTKNPPSTSRASHPFTDIFGTPIKRKSSPEESAKPKEGNAIIQSSQKTTPVHTKPNKVSTSSHSSSNLQPSTKESKAGRATKEKSPQKDSKETKHIKSSKHADKESKQPSSKRQSSPSHAKHGSDKKRKRTASTSSESNSAAPQTVGVEKKADTPKAKHKELKTKEKHKAKPAIIEDIDSSVSNHKKEKSKKSNTSKPTKKLATENNATSPLGQGSQRISDPPCADENSAHTLQPEEKVVDTLLVENKEDSILQVDDLNSSPSSSISLSSLPPGGSHGPLATMMAEMEKDLLSPLSSDPGSPSLSNSPLLPEKPDDNHTTNGDVSVPQSTLLECPSKIIDEVLEDEPFGKKKDETESICKEKKSDVEQGTKMKKDQSTSVKKKREEIDGRVQEETKSHVKKGKNDDDKNIDSESKSSFKVDQAYARELVGLQQKINQLRDREIIQKIVNVIGETGKYDITSSSFDFDLLRLDQMTVQKLQNCFV